MKDFFATLTGATTLDVVIVGAVFVLLGVLLRTLHNFSKGIKSKDKPAQWWAKKAFAFFLGCLLMRFLNLFITIEQVDYLFAVGSVFGFFPEVAIHYWFEAKRKVTGNGKFKSGHNS